MKLRTLAIATFVLGTFAALFGSGCVVSAAPARVQYGYGYDYGYTYVRTAPAVRVRPAHYRVRPAYIYVR